MTREKKRENLGDLTLCHFLEARLLIALNLDAIKRELNKYSSIIIKIRI
jgi:hypothetical protein